MDKVIICRKWNNPKIEAWITRKEIGLSISLEDFLECLVEEMGNPSTMFTKKALLEKLQAATREIVKGVKKESVSIT